MQAVRAQLVLLAPGADELALRIEHDDGVIALARRADGVMDIDVPMRIFADTMRVAIFDVRRQLAPVVNAFVFVLAIAQDGCVGAGFVGCAEDQWRSGGCGEKTAAGSIHIRERTPSVERFPLARSL